MFKRYLLLALQLLFFAAIVVFVAQRYKQLTAIVEPSTILGKPFQLSLSIAGFIIFYSLMAWHWQLLSEKFANSPRSRQWLAFFASQPYKYLPSSLFTFSARAVYAKKLGLSVKQSSIIQLIENTNILIGAGLLVLLLSAFRTSFIWGLSAIALILLFAGVAVRTGLKLPKHGFRLAGREWVRLLALTSVAWLFAGIALYSLITATGQDIALLTAIVANTIAVGLGIIAVFAPGGIGVREFVYVKFAIDATGIIFWRLLTLVLDISLGFLAIYFIKRLKKSNSPLPTHA